MLKLASHIVITSVRGLLIVFAVLLLSMNTPIVRISLMVIMVSFDEFDDRWTLAFIFMNRYSRFQVASHSYLFHLHVLVFSLNLVVLAFLYEEQITSL